MLISEIRAQLADALLFRRVDLEQIAPLLGGCARHRLSPGDTLIEAGTRNSTLFLVISGQLRVYAGGRDLPAHAFIGSGECAGEMSFIDGEAASALVLAAEPSEILAISHACMWEMIELAPMLARNLLAILAGRIRDNNITLVTTQSSTLEFEASSNVDPLTGLHNRHWIDEAFMRMIRRCRNDKEPVCLVLIDIDLLSDINDRNGFLTGDSAIRRLSRIIAESLRPQDLIGRFGGDEFVVLLPQTRPPVALGIANRLCAVIEEAGIVIPPGVIPLTVSCGVVPIKPEDVLDAVFARAEQALHGAKTGGRNRAELLD